MAALTLSFLIQTNSAQAAPAKHKVKAGDSYSLIAQKYGISNWTTIRSANGRTGTTIYIGETLKLSKGTTSSQSTKSTTPSTSNTSTITRGSTYTTNAYAFGNCTWHVSAKRNAIGKGIYPWLGNAVSWKNNLLVRGYSIVQPRAGAIAWSAPFTNGAGFMGHVSYTERVNSNGTVVLSDMNFYNAGGGFNKVSYRTVNASSFTFLDN